MSRFSIDLASVAEELPLIPVGIYPARMVGGEVRTGTTDSGDWANFSIQLVINDEEVSKVLGIDEPRAYFGGMFSFDRETDKFQPNRCPELGAFIKVTGFTNEQDFQTDETEAAESEREYIIALTKAMLESSVGTDCVVRIQHQKKSKNDDTLVSRATKIAIA
jgi:hypothetical protein